MKVIKRQRLLEQLLVDTTSPVIAINTNIALSTHELGSAFLPKNGVTVLIRWMVI